MNGVGHDWVRLPHEQGFLSVSICDMRIDTTVRYRHDLALLRTENQFADDGLRPSAPTREDPVALAPSSKCAITVLALLSKSIPFSFFQYCLKLVPEKRLPTRSRA
jgi:hypothetical protein